MFGDNAKQTMEEFHLQTEKPQNLHNKSSLPFHPYQTNHATRKITLRVGFY